MLAELPTWPELRAYLEQVQVMAPAAPGSSGPAGGGTRRWLLRARPRHDEVPVAAGLLPARAGLEP